MKKLILAGAALLLATGAFAQNFEYGIKAGLNMATATKSDNAKFRPGIHAGAFAEYVINEYVGVQAELLYSMQGTKVKVEGTTSTAKTDYIVLPIFAKIYVVEGLSVDVGPQFGYMVSDNAKVEKGDKDGLKKFDVSAGLGLSYKLSFGLDVYARYNLGLTKVFDGSDSKNSVIQVGVGYRF